MEKSLTTTRISILVDNEVKPGLNLKAEHGFSALIERGPVRILFDTGQGPALTHNTRALKVHLSPLTCAVLSHGHYDHTGGLLGIASVNRPLRVVTHPASLFPHFSTSSGQANPRSIGVPWSKEILEEAGASFDFRDSLTEVEPGVWFTGQVPRLRENSTDDRLFTLHERRLIPDPVEEDASLVLETGSGPVLLLGCAHAGVENILEYVRASLHVERLHAVIGGTHLGRLATRYVDAAIEAFERFQVQCLATAHCTGSSVNTRLKAHFGPRFVQACVGEVFDF